MKRCIPGLRALLVALSLAAAAPSALAAPDDAPAAIDAQRAFDQGQAALDRKDYQSALDAFRDAYTASRSPNARLLIAHCLRELGRLADAYNELEATRAEASTLAESQPKYAKTRDSARDELAALEPKIGKIVVALSDPSGTNVRLNGALLGAERLGVPIAVMPGAAHVEVEFPGKPIVRREEKVPAGQTKTVFVSPPGAGAEKGAPIAPTPAKPGEPGKDEKKAGGGLRVAGFVVAGVGVLGLGAAGVTGLLAKQKYDGLVDACGGVRCTDPAQADTIDAGKQLETISTATLIGGAAAAAIGTVMIVIGGPKAKKLPEASVSFAPGSAMMRLGGSF